MFNEWLFSYCLALYFCLWTRWIIFYFTRMYKGETYILNNFVKVVKLKEYTSFSALNIKIIKFMIRDAKSSNGNLSPQPPLPLQFDPWWFRKKIFYTTGTISSIRISRLAKIPTLLAEILEVRKGLIILVALKGRGW